MDLDLLDRILSTLWDAVDAADAEADVGRRRARIDVAIGDIERALEHHDDPRLWYVLGYARYVHPHRVSSPEIRSALARALHRVLETVPDDAHARLYLGHDAYDLAEYDAALAWFSSVDVLQLSDYLQRKAIEMIVCCRLQLAGAEGARDDLERFVERCARGRSEDIEPLNLFRALRVVVRGGADLGVLAPSLARLDELSEYDWFNEITATRTPERE